MSRILMVASEATPFAKTGGLADVIGALPKALAARGEKVAVVMPHYTAAGNYPDTLKYIYNDMYVWLGQRSYITHIRQCTDGNVDFYFVYEPNLFGRAELYGENGQDYPDNYIRFGVLSRAVLGIVRHLFRPDVIHCHDWQAALVGPYMRHFYALDPTFYGIKLVMTIHNIGYQGLFAKQTINELGFDRSIFRPDLMEFYGLANLLKAGIVYSDWVTTVSRGYAREIQTPEYGFGLDGLLRARSATLSGIINGVDYGEWSPDTDRYITCHYSADNLGPKQQCKRQLLGEFGLGGDGVDRPLIGTVSRFVGQKGFDIITEIGDQLAQEDAYFIALGTGEPQYDEAMSALASRHPGKVGLRLGYDNELAHRIEAGSDMFLMPSRYEPCGLNQIYSLRYGTVPIVRATGGLDDTIDGETGFKFEEYSGTALLGTIRAALRAYEDRDLWRSMMRAGMAKDFSWSASAAEYGALYASLTSESFRAA